MKSTRIGRVVQILMALQARKSYKAGDLAKMLGTSRRTIFRDLRELQAVGIPYNYDSTGGGYRLDPEFFLPPLDLNLQEALSLLLLVHKTRGQIQLPFKNSALLAALKIENNLPEKIRQYCDTALHNVSVKPPPQAPTTHLDRTFAQLQNAIMKKRRVRLLYHSLLEGKLIDLQLWPYHLFYNQRAWYVLGRSSLHKTVRTFKLNRIRELKTLDKCFTNGEKFNPADYFGRAWAMIPEGRLYDIKLRFLPMVANNVAEVQWHSTQKVTRNSDNSITVEFRVDGLGEITWWILGYGDQVQVLAPKALRKKLCQITQKMAQLNKD